MFSQNSVFSDAAATACYLPIGQESQNVIEKLLQTYIDKKFIFLTRYAQNFKIALHNISGEVSWPLADLVIAFDTDYQPYSCNGMYNPHYALRLIKINMDTMVTNK